VRAAVACGNLLRTVICEVDRRPLVWTAGGRSIALLGEFRERELELVLEAMAPWYPDGTSGVDGELHFRTQITSGGRTRGVVVHVRRHGRLDVSAAEPVLKSTLERGCNPVLVVGPPQAREDVLRELCRLCSTGLGTATAVVDPSGRIGGRGNVPHPTLRDATWIPVHSYDDVIPQCASLASYAGPRVIVTAADSLQAAERLASLGGEAAVIVAVPVDSLDPPPPGLTELADRFHAAAFWAEGSRLSGVTDLKRALAMIRRGEVT